MMDKGIFFTSLRFVLNEKRWWNLFALDEKESGSNPQIPVS